MIVLALDIAGKASGAAFDGVGARPRFSTLRQELDGDEFGRVGTKFRQWLLDLLTLSGAVHCAFEAPFVPSGNRAPSHPTSARVPRLLLGLAFLAEQIAHERGIRCSEAQVSTVRKHFCGHGRPTDPKKAVMIRCQQLGWTPSNDHEADAGALFAYSKSLLCPRWSPMATPLFARSAAE